MVTGDAPPTLARRVSELSAQFAAANVALDLVSGALCDAGSVVVEPYHEGIRALIKERDEARAELAALRADPVWAKMAAIAAGLGDVHDKLQADRISRLRAVAVAALEDGRKAMLLAREELQPGDLDSETEGEPK
jgi:hypothetical protein